ncbi:unnamed protein product [Protopolystoma xenopodis]|uniref:Secreted protein n=1 Tax=Protopolystoma xenopodis TaxID=117903 RepID=A0A3S5CS43_9PLAT|nr:unnamed protein product [Protopolystoma xenopodis]
MMMMPIMAFCVLWATQLNKSPIVHGANYAVPLSWAHVHNLVLVPNSVRLSSPPLFDSSNRDVGPLHGQPSAAKAARRCENTKPGADAYKHTGAVTISHRLADTCSHDPWTGHRLEIQ